MTEQNSTTPQPDQQPPAAPPTQQVPPVVQPVAPPSVQPTQQLPVAAPTTAHDAAAEQAPKPAEPPAPVPAPQHSPAPQTTPAQHPVPAQNAASTTSPSPVYVNPYATPATATATATDGSKTKNRTWVPVVSAAAAAALLASLGTAGAISLTSNSDTAASLADVGQSTSQNVPVADSTVENPNWTAVTSAVQESVVAIQVESQAGGAEGSGVVLDSDGRVLTNNHVVADATSVQVTLSDGRVYDAEIVGTDPTSDLAVVQLTDPPSDLQAATFADSSEVVVGEPVLALGNPLGLANTATTGIVSALDRPVTASAEDGSSAVVTNAIQIDAAVNPGNSGGPLFNASGEVIGITSSIATLSSGLSSSTSGSIGLGFAIPSNLATQISAQLVEDGTAEHAFLGVSLEDATATADGVTRRGAGVASVVADSPAGDAGIQEGDVIVAIDGDAVNGPESLTAFVREKAVGDEAVLTVVRDGSTQEITVTLAVLDEAATEEPATPQEQTVPPQEDSSGSSTDPTQPGNIPDWLQELLPNQG
ncbi:S1C family serine protease [Promicromonospora sp. Populi]|uniref:S1C family serine protease n=1 Tax=Promicromonospora sp. Populi TaxID=3239420 RepID=UPI0034E19FF6